MKSIKAIDKEETDRHPRTASKTPPLASPTQPIPFRALHSRTRPSRNQRDSAPHDDGGCLLDGETTDDRSWLQERLRNKYIAVFAARSYRTGVFVRRSSESGRSGPMKSECRNMPPSRLNTAFIGLRLPFALLLLLLLSHSVSRSHSKC